MRRRWTIRDPNHREQSKYLVRWVAQQIIEVGVDASWAEGKIDIKRSSLCVTVKFWRSIARHRLSPTFEDNALTWDRVVLVASLIVGYDIDFTRLIMRSTGEIS